MRASPRPPCGVRTEGHCPSPFLAGARCTEVLSGGRPEAEGQGRQPGWCSAALLSPPGFRSYRACLEGWVLGFFSCQQASRAQVGARRCQGALGLGPTSPPAPHTRMGGPPLPQGPTGHHMGVSTCVTARGPRKQSCAADPHVPHPRSPGYSQGRWRARAPGPL